MQETSDVIDNLAFSIVWANKTKHLEFFEDKKEAFIGSQTSN